MKLKYYLRGLGIGILAATIILMIAFSMHKDDISDEEIIRRAQVLGMEMIDTENTSAKDQIPEKKETETPTETEIPTVPQPTEQPTEQPVDTEQSVNTEQTGTTEQSADQPANTPEIMDFNVAKGDSSNMVANKLYVAGLVNDPKAFNTYMVEQGLDNFVQPGDFEIPVGATYEEIANLLIVKPEDRPNYQGEDAIQ